VIYELKAGGVDERRLVGAKLEKLAEGDGTWLSSSSRLLLVVVWAGHVVSMLSGNAIHAVQL